MSEFENQPDSESQLVALELDKMKGELSLRFNPENFHQNFALSPMEHEFIGSTSAGKAYHPNHPKALVGGATIEKINQTRRDINSHGGYRFILGLPTGAYIDLIVRFNDLDEEIIKSRATRRTFNIVGARKSFQDDEIPLPENVDELVQQKMDRAQAKAKKELANQ